MTECSFCKKEATSKIMTPTTKGWKPVYFCETCHIVYVYSKLHNEDVEKLEDSDK